MIRQFALAATLAAISMVGACASETPGAGKGPEIQGDADQITIGEASIASGSEGKTAIMADASETDAQMTGRAVRVPLTPGVYLREGTGCENPANASWRIWDGEGLSGSATRECRAIILSREGNEYTIRNSCENTYDGSRTPETLTMAVPDQVHSSINGAAFQSCATAQVPEALRTKLTDREEPS